MTKYWWTMLLFILCACGVENITSPPPQEAPPPVVAAVPQPLPQGEAAPPPVVPPSVRLAQVRSDGSVLAGSEFVGGVACVYTYADYQKQTFSHSYPVSGNGAITPFTAGKWECGKTFTIQLDVQRGAKCPLNPFDETAWDGGWVAGLADIKYTTVACPKPQPTPTPTPSPTPTPCAVSWVQQAPTTVYGEWSKCKKDNEINESCTTCSQHRTNVVTIKEKNTCTGELRIKSVTSVGETQSCKCS